MARATRLLISPPFNHNAAPNLASLPDVLLMGPGPSYVPQAIYDPLSARTLRHLNPVCISITEDIRTKMASW